MPQAHRQNCSPPAANGAASAVTAPAASGQVGGTTKTSAAKPTPQQAKKVQRKRGSFVVIGDLFDGLPNPNKPGTVYESDLSRALSRLLAGGSDTNPLSASKPPL